MATADRTHWDEKYGNAADRSRTLSLPQHFDFVAEQLAGVEDALEIACGTGTAAVWLASLGVRVTGYDISTVAISTANELATEHGVTDRCSFAAHDFDHGLPAGDSVDLVVCNMFRDAALDDAIVERLRPGGFLAIAALSEVGAQPGRFRVTAGELPAAFPSLEPLTAGEGDGVAWFVARKPD
jgi:SAM-dependent methyltransferase